MILMFNRSLRAVFNIPTFAPHFSRLSKLSQRFCTITSSKMNKAPENGPMGEVDIPATAAVIDGALPPADREARSGSEATSEAPPRGDYPWRRAKKVAAMLSFSGKDYFGMQRNPGMRTIEEELMAAFRHSTALQSVQFGFSWTLNSWRLGFWR
jgi:hypothetical protein